MMYIVDNKRRIIEEVEYLAQPIQEKDVGVGQESALKMALSELDGKFKMHGWTVDQLIHHCRNQKAARVMKRLNSFYCF